MLDRTLILNFRMTGMRWARVQHYTGRRRTPGTVQILVRRCFIGAVMPGRSEFQ